MKKINDLGRDNMLGLVLRLAIPSMIAQLVNVLYCIIDRMYIGNIPEIGTVALAGVGVCGPIVTLLSSFGTLVGIGGSILMAMKLGEGDEKTAKQVLSNSFLLLLVFSGLLTVSFLLLKDHLLIWFGASDITFVYADTYMTIYTLGTFFALLAIGLGSFITCQGFANISMAAVLIGACGNILLDTVFVLLLNWGVAGAAWATVLSQMASCLFSVIFLFRSRRIRIRISFGGYSGALMKRILTIGVSPFLILATDSVLLIAMNAMLKKYGGPTEGDLLITAVTIVQSFMLLVTGPMIGVTGGTQAIISYNYGARQTARVRQAERYILTVCLIFTSVMFLLSRTVPQYFVGIFTQDPQTVALAVWGIQVFTLSIVPLSLQYTFVDGLTALGCTRVSLFLSLSRKTIFLLCVVFLPAFFSARAAFYAEPICDFIGAITSSILFLFTFRPHLERRETTTV